MCFHTDLLFNYFMQCAKLFDFCFYISTLFVENTDSSPNTSYPEIEVQLSGLEMKSCRTEVVTASSGNIGSISICVHKNGNLCYNAIFVVLFTWHSDLYKNINTQELKKN